MELQGEDGALIFLDEGCRKELGRGQLIAAKDPTVSRRQVLIELQKESNGVDEEGGFNRVYVEVLGPNPICILRSGALKHKSSPEFLRKGQSSYLRIGDRFSLSVKNTHFFTLKKKEEKGSSETGNEDEDEEKSRIEEAVSRRQRRAMERKQQEKLQCENEELNRAKLDEERGKGKQGPMLELELEEQEQDETEIQDLDLLQSVDISHIDPVAEFGFLVEGSEFEQYGRRRVHDVGQWDLFLGKDSEKSSEDEDEDEDLREEQNFKGKKGKHKKKREAKDEKEDEEWTDESEEEKMQINKLKGSKKPRVLKTRTSSRGDSSGTVLATTGFNKKQLDDDIDETLGGFIVDDEVETTDGEEEEEEFQLTDDDSKEGDEDKDDMVDECQQGKSSKERKPLCKFGTHCYRKNKKHLEEFRHAR